jgi:Na+/H+-dicarboxylate symporter
VRVLRTYAFSLTLMAAIAIGLALGRLAPDLARAIRPLGVLFLNLVFMVIVPLVFFTIASSIAATAGSGRLTRISRSMILVFLFTSVVVAVTSLLFMLMFQPTPGAGIVLRAPPPQKTPPLLDQLVKTVTAADFPELLSRRSMLPLILFAVGFGFATRQLRERGEAVARVLASGAHVCMRLVDYVMAVAPVGLLAYFAATVADTGERVATAYLKVFWVYYVFAAIYFVGGFTLYAFLAGRGPAVRRFWAHMLRPTLTAAGTCSSMATMPVNMEAAPRMGVPLAVRDLVIPLGAAIHKDGSVIGGVVKILFLFSVFHQPHTFTALLLVVGVSILVGVVMGAIPSGGLVGEMLILSVFGFPAEALPLIAVISVIIDPPATVLNATGDNVAAMLVTRLTDGDVWAAGAAAPPDQPAA